MEYNNRPVYDTNTLDYSVIKVGDYVTTEVVNEAMDLLPPVCMRSSCSQIGEPHSHKLDERCGRYRPTFATFCVEPLTNLWKFCGYCFAGEVVERGKEPPYVAAAI